MLIKLPCASVHITQKHACEHTLRISSGLFSVCRIRDGCTVYVPSHPRHGGTVGGCRCVKITVGHAHRGGLVYTAVYKGITCGWNVLGSAFTLQGRRGCSLVHLFSTCSGLGENHRTSVSPEILFPWDEFSGRGGILFQVRFVLIIFQKIAFDTLAPSLLCELELISQIA